MPVTASPIVDLESEVKPFLAITGNESDAKLTSFIATASQMIVNKVGQVAGSPTIDEWYDGGTERLALRNGGPIESVTSVSEVIGTTTYTLSEVTLDTAPSGGPFTFSVDLDRAVIVRRAAGVAVRFAAGVQNIHVVYVAGYSVTPADIKHACLLLVKHLWETQRGPTARPGAGGNSEGVGGMWPPRVSEILAQYQIPGIA